MKRDEDLTPEPAKLPSGHVYGRDGTGKYLFQSTLTTTQLAEEFERAVERIGDLRKLPVGQALYLSLPIRHAICTPTSLSAAPAAMAAAL